MSKSNKKEKKDIWMHNIVESELKEMREGEFKLDKQRKIRYKKTRIPKWLKKYNEYGKASHINFRKEFGRWAYNEERIIMEMFSSSETSIRELVKRSKIDYKNISRCLHSLEKKGLVKIERDYKFKTMPSGTLKRYNDKKISITKKGSDKRKEYMLRDY